MELDEDQKQHVEEHLKKMTRGRCPMCELKSWSVLPKAVEIRDFTQHHYAMGTAAMPLIAIVCEGCGFTALFSAIKLGIVQPSQDQTVTSPAARQKGATDE